MKTNKKTSVFLLLIVISLIRIDDSVQSNQIYTLLEKSDRLLPKTISKSQQEQQKYHYIGTYQCASVCHDKEEIGSQYTIMKNGPHSQAFKILGSKKASHFAKKAKIKVDPQESTACLKCHVTGGDLDSSFFSATYKKDDGVTCEACHKGPYITKSFIPSETDCLKCHNDSVHKISKFDFSNKSAKIAHPRPKAEPKKI
jgi:hypothetical protein